MNVDVSHLEPCDSLYLSPHADDALASCAGRIAAEVGQGQSVLIVSLFASGAPTPDGAIRHVSAGAPPARERSGTYASYSSLALGQEPQDEPWVKDAAEVLRQIGYRTAARQVYVPLGVGTHIDHRLCHDAGLRAFRSGANRNVFLYEERPEAFVPGAVRMRLAQLGAWLPPGAKDAADDTGLARFLLRFHVPATARGDLSGFGERLRSTAVATTQWRASRAWSPLKGLGPRLQPMVHAVDEVTLPRSLELAASCAPAGRIPPRLQRRLAALQKAYTRRLGAAAAAERYWLLLPTRGRDGQSTLATPGSEESLPA